MLIQQICTVLKNKNIKDTEFPTSENIFSIRRSVTGVSIISNLTLLKTILVMLLLPVIVPFAQKISIVKSVIFCALYTKFNTCKMIHYINTSISDSYFILNLLFL